MHSASAPQVSIVIATPAEQAGEELSPQELSVTVRGRRLPATVTPVASSSLSVALVIDTAADTPPDVMEAVQSGATEFLLRLPTGARSAVITAGGDPRVVAPLTVEPAAGVTAISAMRPDGPRSTAAGVMLAAQELATAPPGPRQNHRLHQRRGHKGRRSSSSLWRRPRPRQRPTSSRPVPTTPGPRGRPERRCGNQQQQGTSR